MDFDIEHVPIEELPLKITRFILSSDYDSEESLVQSLRALPGSMSRCTVKWGAHHTAYRCKTCGISPSSCICVECFERGEHQDHEFVLYTSNSGGCCDCGDPTSWRPEGNCSAHCGAKNAEDPEKMQSLEDLILDKSLKDRIELACKDVIRIIGYVDHFRGHRAEVLLNWLQEISSWADPVRELAARVFCEGDLLEKSIAAGLQVNQDELKPLTNLFLEFFFDSRFKWNFARVFISKGYYGKYHLASLEEHGSKNMHLDKLTVQIFTGEKLCANLCEQNHLIAALLNGLDELFSSCKSLVKYPTNLSNSGFEIREIFALSPSKISPSSTFNAIWQIIHDLKTVLSHDECSLLMIHDSSVVSAFFALVRMVHQMFVQKRNHPDLSFNVIPQNERNDLISNESLDLIFLREMKAENYLATQFSEDELSTEEKRNLSDEDDPHSSFVQWSSPIRIEMELISVQKTILESFAKKPKDAKNLCLLHNALSILFKEILWISHICGVLDGLQKWEIHPFLLREGKIGLNIPVHRMFCMLLEFMYKHFDLDPLKVFSLTDLRTLAPIQEELLWKTILEYPLRVIALAFQTKSELWIENNQQLWLPVQIYLGGTWGPISFDFDVSLVQMCLYSLNKNLFFASLLRKFEVGHHLTLYHSSSSKSEIPEISPRQLSLLRDMFLFIFYILKNDSSIWIDSLKKTKNDIIHWLAVHDMSYSEICNCFPSYIIEDFDIDLILKEIAIYHQPKKLESGKFKLKQSFWKEFDPLYLYYDSSQREKAQSRYLENQKSKNAVYEILYEKDVSERAIFQKSSLSAFLFAMVYSIIFKYVVFPWSIQNADILLPALRILEIIIMQSDPQFGSSDHKFDLEEISSPVCSISEIYSVLKEKNSSYWFITIFSEKLGFVSIIELLVRLMQVSSSSRYFNIIHEIIRKCSILTPIETMNASVSICNQHLLSEFLHFDAVVRANKLQEAKKERKEKSKLRQQRIMKIFSDQRNRFAQKNGISQSSSASNSTQPECDVADNVEEKLSIAEEKSSEIYDSNVCSICMNKVSEISGGSYGYAAFIQRSHVLMLLDPATVIENHFFRHQISLSSKNDTISLEYVPSKIISSRLWKERQKSKDHQIGSPVIRSCGHALHFKCCSNYIVHELSRSPERDLSSLDLYAGEFYCPICRRLCNLIIPVECEKAELVETDQPRSNSIFSFFSQLISSDSNVVKKDMEFDSAVSEFFIRIKLHSDISSTNLETDEILFNILESSILVAELNSRYERREDFTINGSFALGSQRYQLEVFNSLYGVYFHVASQAQKDDLSTFQSSIFAKFAGVDSERLVIKNALHLKNSKQDSSFMSMLNELLSFHICRSIYVLLLWFSKTTDFCKVRLHQNLDFDFASENVKTISQFMIKVLSPHFSLTREFSAALCEENNFLRSYVEMYALPVLRVAYILHIAFFKEEPIISHQSHFKSEISFLMDYFGIDPDFSSLNFRKMNEWFNRLSLHDNDDLIFNSLKNCESVSLMVTPRLYQSLYTNYLTTKCSSCEKIPKHPALCLICGDLCCLSSLCCSSRISSHEELKRVDECEAHAMTCGSGVGVYLLLRESVVMLMFGSRICFWGALHLDSHGEQDVNLRRGNPLFLSESRQKALNNLWISSAMIHEHHTGHWTWIERTLPLSD